MKEGRWVTVTPSQFQHEREALEYVRKLLPDAEPFRAWSNFTFTASTGHVREVDLLVAAPSGIYLIEIKSLNGRLGANGSNWILTAKSGYTRAFDNPLHLADSKAKQLKSLLQRAAARKRDRPKIPFIQAAVFLSVPSLDVQLPDHHLHRVYGTAGQTALPEIYDDLLKVPPADDSKRLTLTLSRQLGGLLKDVGIARSRKHFQVGSWRLEAPPFDVGPTWEDYHAVHARLPDDDRRIRVFMVERNADQAMRASITRAAEREVLALRGIQHPGIVQVDSLEEHEAGPALIFRHDRRAMRLDHYMAQYGPRLSIDIRLDMIRQLAEALSYAHRRHLYHRALSARSVLVTPTRVRGGGDEAGWLRPHLKISDWQAATRGPDSDGYGGLGEFLGRSSSSHAGHVEKAAEAYLAPELTVAEAGPERMDTFGLGAICYLLLTGRPPATSRAELLTLLQQNDGLVPSGMADSMTVYMDELVQKATAPVPRLRTQSVAEFLDGLERVEDDLTAPEPAATTSTHPAEPGNPDDEERDPLEARPGDHVGGRWEVVRRIGTGSTARVFLALNLETERYEILKVALSDEKTGPLEHEASILRRLESDSRIIRLARDELVHIADRAVLVLDHGTDPTVLSVARKLHDDGRLTVDELEIYAEYLFGAVDFLDGQGISHRDIKPANIAIRTRPNRTRQLVLFDFSLAGISVKEIAAGTPGYLDPFLGSATRQVYDPHAERYAIAVTLHEMASGGERPVWGDGETEPSLTEGPPTLATEAFDPAIRDGLVEFFQNALHRNVKNRFESLHRMQVAWRMVFRASDAALPVGSEHGELPAEKETPEAIRDKAAAKATRATVLDVAGLTQRAVSAAARLGATTVGDLLDLPSKALFTLPGLGARTRRELQQRVREWRRRLGDSGQPTGDKRVARESEPANVAAPDLARTGLDRIAETLLPPLQQNGRNAAEVEATRLLLGLPDASGPSPLPPWPRQPQVARTLQPPITTARVGQILARQRDRWRREPLVGSVLDEIIDLLDDGGRVMGAGELADAILARRGTEQIEPELRRALALAAVRAAAEADPIGDEPHLIARRHGDRIMLALEVTEEDAPDTPAGPALLDYADALGKAADRLANRDVLPTPATVLRELRAVKLEGVDVTMDDRRLVFLAAAASDKGAATARLEIYPCDLDAVRALRLAQAGVIPRGKDRSGRPTGLSPSEVAERVAARFPALAPIPDRPTLDRLLREAGFDARWDQDRYVAPPLGDTTRTPGRRSPARPRSNYATNSPELAEALRANERLQASANPAEFGLRGGFRALTAPIPQHERARRELIAQLGVTPLNVSKLFLEELRGQLVPTKKPEWATLLKADTADPGTRAATNLGRYVEEAWRRFEPRLLEARARTTGPLLLHDAAPIGRYNAADLLFRLIEEVRKGGPPTWLLCPMPLPERQPALDGMLVPVQLPYEWIDLPNSWLAREHLKNENAS